MFRTEFTQCGEVCQREFARQVGEVGGCARLLALHRAQAIAQFAEWCRRSSKECRADASSTPNDMHCCCIDGIDARACHRTKDESGTAPRHPSSIAVARLKRQ